MTPEGWFLVGAPWDCSGTGRGEQAAPEALRSAGLTTLVAADLGDAPTVIDTEVRDDRTGVRALDQTVAAARALDAFLADGLGANPAKLPLVIGGDCSILLGVVPALTARFDDVGLWFLDGHPDYLDGFASETGETADMDLALVTGVGAEELTTLSGRSPMLDPRDAILIGHRTRGLDPASQDEVDRVPAELQRIDASSLLDDPAAAGRRAAGWLAASGRRGWLHIDLDVLDPQSLSAVTYPQPGGPDWADLGDLIHRLLTGDNLLGVSVADFRPDLDTEGTLARRIVALLEGVLP
jgi:arginase